MAGEFRFNVLDGIGVDFSLVFKFPQVINRRGAYVLQSDLLGLDAVKLFLKIQEQSIDRQLRTFN